MSEDKEDHLLNLIGTLENISNYKKQRKEWVTCFKKARDLTGFWQVDLEFGKLGVYKKKMDMAAYSGNSITVNRKCLREIYSKNVKIGVTLHEFGHHAVENLFDNIEEKFNREDPNTSLSEMAVYVPEFFIERIVKYYLSKFFGKEQGKKIYREYRKI